MAAGNISHRDFDFEVYDAAMNTVRAGNIEALRALIDTRFGVQNQRNTNILYYSIERGNFETTKILLDAGVDRDYHVAKHELGPKISPLYAAVRIENSELRSQMIKLLIESGVDPRKENLYNESCIYKAAELGDCDTVKHLFEAGVDVNHPNKYGDGFSPLHAAIKKLDGQIRLNMVKLLIEIGAHVNACTKSTHLSCLHMIPRQKNGSREVFKLLLDAGAVLNSSAIDGSTPLGHAANFGDCELMRDMIAAGADINPVVYHCSSSPLYFAVSSLHEDAVLLLLESGADSKVKSQDGHSILSLAARFWIKKNKEAEYIKILKILFANGATHDFTENEAIISFQSVLTYGTLRAMFLFFENGFTLENCGVSNLLHRAAQNCSKDILEYLLKNHRYNVDEIVRVDDRSFTALCVAIQSRWADNVRLLIKWGADVNIPLTFQSVNPTDPIITTSMLDLALSHPDKEIVDLLLAAGASVNLRGLNDESRAFDNIIGFQPREPKCRDILKSVIGEIILLKSRRRLDPNYTNNLVGDWSDVLPDFEEQCMAELDLLKNIIFYGSVTLYDILRGKDVTRYLDNTEVVGSFEHLRVGECFPIYGNRLENCYSLAQVRREVVDEATKVLNTILQFRFDHDHDILDTIISHLSLKDLRYLCHTEY